MFKKEKWARVSFFWENLVFPKITNYYKNFRIFLNLCSCLHLKLAFLKKNFTQIYLTSYLMFLTQNHSSHHKSSNNEKCFFSCWDFFVFVMKIPICNTVARWKISENNCVRVKIIYALFYLKLNWNYVWDILIDKLKFLSILNSSWIETVVSFLDEVMNNICSF